MCIRFHNSISAVCLFTQNAYTPQDVHILYKQIQKHTSLQNFICFTDRSSSPLPFEKQIKWNFLQNPYHTWWNKIYFFQKNRTPFRYLVYFDLDVLLLKNMDFFIQKALEYEFSYAVDFIEGLSSSFMVIDTHSKTAENIFKNFHPKNTPPLYINDQDFLEKYAFPTKHRCFTFPPEAHFSYKYYINDQNWRSKTKNPAIQPKNWNELYSLNFHGYPKPKDIFHHPKAWDKGNKIKKEWNSFQ